MSGNGDLAEEALRRAEQIHPHLRGIGPELQGAILAELTSLWLAGHHPVVRDEVWAQFVKIVLSLTPVNAKIVRGE